MNDSNHYFLFYISPDDLSVLQKKCDTMNDHLELRGQQRTWTLHATLQTIISMGIFELKRDQERDIRTAQTLQQIRDAHDARQGQVQRESTLIGSINEWLEGLEIT